MANIFVSYDREDTDFSEVVQAKLQKGGHTTFMDLELLSAGDDWRDKIDQALRDSHAVVVVMTPESAASSYVTYEWAFALGAGVTVIPLELRPTEFHPRLDVLQRLDFTRKERPWEKLLDEVEKAAAAHTPSTVGVAPNAPPAIKHAAAALDSLDSEQQLLAVQNLAQMDHPAAREALSKALEHPCRTIRIAAAFKFPDRKDPRILPGLLEACRDWQTEEAWYGRARESLTECASAMGAPAVPVLLPFLQSDSSRIRARAATALGCLRDGRAIPPLRQALTDPSDEVRAQTVWALGEMGDVTVGGDLQPLLRDECDYVRSAAVDALGTLKDKSALPELIRLMQEDRSDVRQSAARALGKIGDPGALPPLLQALRDEAIREDVAGALGLLGDPSAIAELRRILGALDEYADEYQNTRYAAATALLRLGDDASIPAIVEAVKAFAGGTPPCEVVATLGERGEIAVPGLVDILMHSRSTREDAAKALKRIGTPAALDAVKRWEFNL